MKPGDAYNPFKLFHGAFIPTWLMETTEVLPSAKLVFARLAQHAGRNGKAFPRQETLARECGMSERQVRRLLNHLEEVGLIEMEQAQGAARLAHAANRYKFLWHEMCDACQDVLAGEDADVLPGEAPGVLPINDVKENQYEEEGVSSSGFPGDGNGNGPDRPDAQALRMLVDVFIDRTQFSNRSAVYKAFKADLALKDEHGKPVFEADKMIQFIRDQFTAKGYVPDYLTIPPWEVRKRILDWRARKPAKEA